MGIYKKFMIKHACSCGLAANDSNAINHDHHSKMAFAGDL